MANITLNSLVYVGQGLLNGIATWINSASGIVSSFNRLSARVRIPQRVSAADQYSTVKWQLELPWDGGVPAGTCPCTGDWAFSPSLITVNARFDARCPQTVRDAALASLKDLVLKAEFSASVSSLTQPSG